MARAARITAVWWAAILTLWSCSISLPRASFAQSHEMPDVVESEIQRLMEAAHVPGAQIAAVSDGQVGWHAAFGVKSMETDAPVTDTTIFEAASLSKPVFAYAVLRLADRGALDLDEPLWNTLAYDRLTHDRRAQQITPRMVLSHTTGLPNWGGTPLELNRDPGAGWGYSGEGYVYLQRAVEKMTGRSLDELVRREVFEPLGMTQSAFVWQAAYDDQAATGHDLIGDPQPKRKPDDGNAASSLHTTATEYARFLAAVLRGEGLSDAMHERFFTRQPQSQVQEWGPDELAPYLHWGLGWGLQDGERGAAIWHWGDNGSFRAYVVGYPGEQSGVVYFTNSENGLSIAEDVLALADGDGQAEDTHYAVQWLGYDRYDDPAHQARIATLRTFMDEGAEAGLRRVRAYQQDSTVVLPDDALAHIGRFLASRDRTDDALTVLKANVEDNPTAEAWQALGEAQVAAGAHKAALDSYRKALDMDPEMKDDLTPRMAWLQEGIEARSEPVSLTDEALQRLAGPYGPRQITFEDGHLYYAREGATTKTRLTPLTETLFALESSNTFRLRFETDGEGPPAKITGLYADGRTDESLRTRTSPK